jgi:hypothetical protein
MKGRGVLLASAALAGAAALLVGIYLAPGPNPSEQAVSSSGPSDTAASGGLAATDGKVDIEARWTQNANDDGADAVTVTLDIDNGWHVNANPASLDFLIPTTVSAHAGEDQVDADVEYPPGRPSGIRLQDTEIEVYEDGTEITVRLSADARARIRENGGLDLAVRAQSCSDDGTCLAPSTLRASLPAKEG